MLTREEKKYAFWNSSIFIFTQVTNFVIYTLNLKTFGFEQLGSFLLLSAILGIGSAIDFGFGISTVKHISEARKKNDLSLVNSIYVTFFVIFLILAVVIFCIYISYYFVSFKDSGLIDTSPMINMKLIFFLLVLSFFFSYMSGYFRSVCEGFARFVSLGKILFCVSIINLLLNSIIYIAKLEIVYLALFLLFGNFVLFIILFIYTSKYIEGVRFEIKHFNFALIKKYSLYNLNLQLTFFIANFVDFIIKFCLGRYLSLSYVTFFESSKKIINFSNGLIQSAQKGLLNRLSEEMAVDNIRNYINNGLYVYSKMANYYSIIIYGVINPVLCFFIVSWFKSYESMIIFLIFLLPYSLINFCAPPYGVLMIEGKGFKLPSLQIINVLLISVFLFLSINLFNNYLGIIGYYFAIIINVILVFYFLIRTYKFDYRNFLSKTNFTDILKLSFLVITEFIVLFYFKEYYLYLLIAYFVIFMLLFRLYVIYFSKLIYSKLKFNKILE